MGEMKLYGMVFPKWYRTRDCVWPNTDTAGQIRTKAYFPISFSFFLDRHGGCGLNYKSLASVNVNTSTSIRERNH
jgi:hypothetical protein